MSSPNAPSTVIKLVDVLERVPDIAIRPDTGMVVLDNLKAAYTLATIVWHSRMVPDQFKSPDQVATCFLMGARLQIDPFTALWQTAIVHGRPTIYGDLPLAICMSRRGVRVREWTELDGKKLDRRPLFKTPKEWPDSMTWCCEVLDRDGEVLAFDTFSIADARAADLFPPSKAGAAWGSYTYRMGMFRARTYALRSACPDVLMGLSVFEEFAREEEMPSDAQMVKAEVVGDSEPAPKTAKDLAPARKPQAAQDDEIVEDRTEDPIEDEPGLLAEEIRREVTKRDSTWDATKFVNAVKVLGRNNERLAVYPGSTLKDAIQHIADKWPISDLRLLLTVVRAPWTPDWSLDKATASSEPEPTPEEVHSEPAEDDPEEGPITTGTRLSLAEKVDKGLLTPDEMRKALALVRKGVTALRDLNEREGMFLLSRIESGVILDDIEAGRFNA